MRTIGASVPFAPMRKSWYRNEIEAINRTYGMPTFFITVNPADLKCPIAKILCGIEVDEETKRVLTGDGVFRTTKDETLFRKFTGHMSASNPVACAEYFHRIMKVITEILFGYRDSQFHPTVFGKLNAYYGVVEQQQRKTLHCHMLIWVRGFESYESFHENMRNDILYKQRFLIYINSLIKCTMDLKVDVISKLNPSSFVPDEDSDPINLEKEFKYNTEWVIRKCQVHKCSIYHCKKGNRKCRYKFPIRRCHETTYDPGSGVLTFARNHNWINHYNPLLSAVFRCNNDIKFLPGLGDAKISSVTAWYMCWYSAKFDISNMRVVRALLHHCQSMGRKMGDDFEDDAHKLFRHLTHRALNLMIAAGEKGGPEVASFLLGYGDRITSAQFVPIFWTRFDMYVISKIGGYDKHTYKVLHTRVFEEEFRMHPSYQSGNRTLDPVKDKIELQEMMRLSNDRMDYTCRPETMEHICLFDFFRLYKKEYVSRLPTLSRASNRFIGFFQDAHPDKGKFAIVAREVTKIVLLPKYNLKSPVCGVGTEAFSRLMMILFKPWREPNTLLGDHDSFHNSFLEFKNHLREINELSSQPFSFMTAFERDGVSMKEAVNRPRTSDTSSTLDMDSDEDTQDYGFESDDDMQQPSDWKRVDYSKIDNITTCQKPNIWKMSGTADFESGNSIRSADDIKDLMSRVNHMNNQAKSDKLSNFTIENDQFDQFNDIRKSFLQNRTVINIESRVLLLEQYAARLLATMNGKLEQQAAFKIVADHLIQNLNDQQPHQLRMCVVGEGGTGKSYLISVIRELFFFSNNMHWLSITAPTGRAANLINGETLHAAFKIGRSLPKLETMDDQTMDEQRRLSDIRYMIIDEISMMAPETLGYIQSYLEHVERIDKEEQAGTSIMVGKNMIFFGDFFQFAPVLSKSLVNTTDLSISSFPNARQIYASIGYSVFNSFDKMIELRTQVRQTDSNYHSFLQRLRKQELTSDDFDLIRSRIISSSLFPSDKLSIPAIVSSNKRRAQINSNQVLSFAEDSGRQITKCPPLDLVMGNIDNRDIQDLTTEQVNHLDGTLLLVIGMKIMILENLYKYIGITNGTIGTLEQIIYTEPSDHSLAAPIISCLMIRVHWNESSYIIPVQRSSTQAKKRNRRGGQIQVHRKQFPVTPAYAITDYKSQGSSYESAIIDLVDGRGPSNYVKLSRVKTLNGLFIAGEFKDTDLKVKFTDGADIFMHKTLNSRHIRTMGVANKIHFLQ